MTTTEIDLAYAATKALGSPITRQDTDAGALTVEKVKALCDWVDYQSCSTFEDKAGNSFPLQAVLDLWHASVVWDTFDTWFAEEPKPARKAYVAICRKHKIKHGAA